MIRILIVDDEIYAVQALLKGADWNGMGAEASGVYNAAQAREFFRSRPVDILICDIEMPGENGLELVEWVRESYPGTETIFLTCHSDFGYAQRAIQLGSSEYLLKPIIDYDDLREPIRKAAAKLEKFREREAFADKLKTYRQQWEAELPAMVERFWRHVLTGRHPAASEQLEASFDLYRIPLRAEDRVRLILLSIEEWREDFTTRDEEILEYTIRKAADEIILDGLAGAVIQVDPDVNLVLVYPNPEAAGERELAERCSRFIEASARYFYCTLSCYLSEPAPVGLLPGIYGRLLDREKNTVHQSGRVIGPGEEMAAEAGGRLPLPRFGDYEAMFESGTPEDIGRQLAAYFESVGERVATTGQLETVFFAYLQIVSTLLSKKGISILDVYDRKELSVSPIRSLAQLRSGAAVLFERGLQAYRKETHGHSVIERVKAYIHEHIRESVSREEVAGAVFLNAAYLSRLFKRETGVSLSDYIIRIRLERARELLVTTNYKISHIAEMVGYESFPHFTRIFKKMVGVGPHHYRTQHQQLP